MNKTAIWQRERKKIIQIFLEKGITGCEIRLNGCKGQLFCGIAHRKQRSEYYKNPEELSDFNECLLACQPCHEKIDHNKKLKEEMFKRLRV